MTPDPGQRKRAKKKKQKKRPEVPAAAVDAQKDPGPPYAVRWHPDARAERLAVDDEGERTAMLHAAQKLEAEGPRLRAPHQSGVQGEEGQGLRELRPRRGRSRWRPIYRRVLPGIFVILAVAPEAEIDQAGFDAGVARAQRRLSKLELD